MACYKGYRPKSGSCQPCRVANARAHTNYNRSERGHANVLRYQRTAKGMLAVMRVQAKRRSRG